MSRDLWILALKTVLAGTAVVGFSLLAEWVKPKMLAGLFAGAPVVASVSLLITALVKPPSAVQGSLGMIAGALGMVACCLAAALVIPRAGSVAGSAASWVAWGAVAFGVYYLFFG